MCNRYRTDRATAALFQDLANWPEPIEPLDEHGRNAPVPFEVLPNRPGRVVSIRDGRLHITEPLWGMPTPPKFLVTPKGKPMSYDPGVTNIRNASSPHWRRWTGPNNRCLVPFTRFCENAPRTHEATWFGFTDGRPVGYFAGVLATLSRQIRAKDPEPTEAEYFAFLTTEPNTEVQPIHPKAMPVILTDDADLRTWLEAPWEEASKLQKPLPDGSLTIVDRGGTGEDRAAAVLAQDEG